MNQQQTIEAVNAKQLKSAAETPDFTIGDTLNVHVRIVEGDKERIQVYQGVLIAQKGRGINKTITVRRIVANEGVERIFPVHSPRIGASAHRILFGIRLGERVGQSMAAAARLYPDTDPEAVFASLLHMGVFAAPSTERP